MKEFFSLLSLAWENRAYRRKLGRIEREKLGGSAWYRGLQHAIGKAYRWRNPFVLSKLARRKLSLPRADLVYGETPILTAHELLTLCQVDHADHVVELGGGICVFSLVAVSAFGCRATALEIVPSFVKKTREIASSLGLERLTIKQVDILSGTIPEGTLYYLTGTTFTKESWARLQRQVAQAPVGTKAVSLSTPLDAKAWKIEKTVTLPFSWGENTVFLQTRI